MNEVKKYKEAGRRIAKKLYPIDDNMICEMCEKRKATDHQHIDGNTYNNTIENIKKVCRSCHLKEDHKLGNHPNQTKLTQKQIDFIRAIPKGTTILIQQKYADKFGISLSHFGKIKRGCRVPIPRPKKYNEPEIPVGWQARPIGKPRSLSIKQVLKILSYSPALGVKNAKKLSEQFGVTVTSIYKARGRQGCYSDSIYD
jgi:hypothetical protein